MSDQKPWERYASSSDKTKEGPWTKYAAPSSATQEPEEKEVETPEETPSQLGSFGREAGRSVIPGVAGLLGAMGTGAAAGALTGPLAPVAVPIGALAGGIGFGMGARKLQDMASDEIAPESFMGTKSAQADYKANPVSTFAGSLVGMGKPSASALAGSVKALGTQAGRKGIATIAKQIGSKEAREEVERATKAVIPGTTTLTPEAIAAGKAQQEAAEQFGHALGGAAGVSVMTGMGIAEGEDPGTAALKGVAGLAVKPWVGPGGVFLNPYKTKGGAASGAVEQATETYIPPGDSNIESQVDDLLASNSPATAEAAAEATRKAEAARLAKEEAERVARAEAAKKMAADRVEETTTTNPDNVGPSTKYLFDSRGIDQDTQELIAIRLQHILKKKGTLTADDIPREDTDKLDTGSLMLLKERIAKDPQGVIDELNKVGGTDGKSPLASSVEPAPALPDVSGATETPAALPTDAVEPEIDPATPEGRVALHAAALAQKPQNLTFHTDGILRELEEAKKSQAPVTPAERQAQGRTPEQYVENRRFADLYANEPKVSKRTGKPIPSVSQLVDAAIRAEDVPLLQELHAEMSVRKASAANNSIKEKISREIEARTGQKPVAPALRITGENGAPRPDGIAPFDLEKWLEEKWLSEGEEVTEEPVTESQDDIEDFEPPVEINASPKAVELAQSEKINLQDVPVRINKKGQPLKITVADVQKHLNNLAKAQITRPETVVEPPVVEEPVVETSVEEPVAETLPEEPVAESQVPNYWYKDQESQEYFERFESLRDQLSKSTDSKERDAISKEIGDMKKDYRLDPERYSRTDLNNPMAKTFDQAGLADGEGVASLKGAQWRDLGVQETGTMKLREVTLENGIVTYVDLNTLPEPVKDQLDADTPVLTRNISAISRATGRSRNTLTKYEEQGMPTGSVEQAVAWINKRTEEGEFASQTSAAVNSSTSLDAPVGDGDATIGGTFVGTDPNKISGAQQNSTAALVSRAIAHMGRPDVPLVRRLALARMLGKSEIADRLGISDEEYKQISDAAQKVEDELSNPNPQAKSVDTSAYEAQGIEKAYAAIERSEGELVALEQVEGEIESEKVLEIAYSMKESEILSESEFEELLFKSDEQDNEGRRSTSPEELLELLKDRLEATKERLSAAEKIWSQTEGLEESVVGQSSYLSRVSERADRIADMDFTPDQLMDNVVGNGKFEVSPLRSIDTGGRAQRSKKTREIIKQINKLEEYYEQKQVPEWEKIKDIMHQTGDLPWEEDQLPFGMETFVLHALSANEMPPDLTLIERNKANGTIDPYRAGAEAIERLRDSVRGSALESKLEGALERLSKFNSFADPLRDQLFRELRDIDNEQLNAIDTGSQGDRVAETRGEPIRVTHAEDVLYDLANNPEHDSMVNVVAQFLLKKFAGSGKLLRIPVDVHDRLEAGVLGEYDPATGRIALTKDSAAETILEEVLHSLTADRNLPPEIQRLFKTIQAEAVKKGLTSKELWTRAADPTVLNKQESDAFHYAFSNPHELLAAALKNREVRDALNNLEIRDSITGKLVSAWKYLKGELIKWLGFNVKKDSALDQYLNKMFDHMSEREYGEPTLDTESGSGVLYQKVNPNNSQNEKISINPSDIRDSYIKRQYGATTKELPERIAQDLVRTSDGSNLQAALEVSQRSLSGLRPNSKTSEAFRKAAHAAEADALEKWAKENGLFISEDEFNRRWEEQGKRGESEHQVYFDEETQTWWKRNTLNFHDGSLTAYLERIAAQRYLFPELAPKFKGFTTFEGELMPVISQPDAVGSEPTELEITNSLKARGFKEVFETGKGMSKAHQLAIDAGLKPPALPEPKRVGFYNEELNLWLEDVHEENAKKLSNGEIGVFDPVTYFVGREPFQQAQGGKLRAISITPQKPKPTRALEKDLLTADPEVRAMMAGKTYIPESFKQWIDVAEDWITTRVQAGDSNKDIARMLLSGATNGLNTEPEIATAKYVVAQQAKVLKWALEKQIKSAGVKTIADEVQLAEYTTTGNQLTRELSEKATASGKMLAVFRMISRNMNGRYIIDEYLSPIFKQQAAKLSGDKTAQELKTAVQASIETGAEETVGRARTLIRKIFASSKEVQDGFAQSVFDFFDAVRDPDNTSPSKNSTPLGIQYAEKAAASLAKKIAGSVGKESKVNGPALEILQKNIHQEISARMREVFKGIEEKPEFNREAAVKALAEGLDISELSERAFNSAREAILVNPDAKISPAQRAALEGAKFDGGAMKKAQDLLRREVVFRDVVKKTLSDRNASREALIGEIITNSDLSPEQAVRVAESLRQTYEFEAHKSAKTQLDALLKNKADRDARAGIKQIKESDIQKMLKLVNLGAFTEERFYNAISDSYKLPTWDERFSAQIEKEAAEVQALPEGQYRNQRTGDLLNKIATKRTQEVLGKWKSVEGISKILDITTAAWQAGVLSGPPTQMVNLGGSHISVVTETFMESLGYLWQTGDSRYIADGLSTIYGSFLGKRSRQEIGRALQEGTTQYRVNQMEGASHLENLDPADYKGVAGLVASYASKLKYVGRAMLALDAMNMVSADEAKQRMATRFFLEHKQGRSTEQVNEIIRDLFYPDQKVTEGVRATAEKEAAEGMYGADSGNQKKWIERRVSELLQNRREEVYKGVTEQGSNFAEHATYNEGAHGILGRFVAGFASQMNSELKVTKFVLSFMNTLSNIMNQSLDYTVWGALRAKNMSPSQRSFSENSKYAPRKFEEGSPEQSAQFAKSILGTTAFMSLAYLAYKGLLEEQEGKVPFFAIHGAGPRNSMDKQQLKDTQKWEPNSVCIGGHFYRYVDWPALGILLGGLGSGFDTIRYKKDEQTTSEVAWAAALSSASTVLDKNMLSGVTNLFEALRATNPTQQTSSLKRLAGGTVAGFTNPGLVRWARNTFGMDKDGQVARLDTGTTEGWLYSMVPASIGYNTPALNTLGEPIKQPWYSATTWRFVNASNMAPHPIISPIIKAGLILPNPSKATEFRYLDAQGAIVKSKMGKYPEVNRRFVQLRGEAMKEMLTPEMIDQLSQYARENKNLAQDYLDSKIGNAARNHAVKQIEAEILGGKLKLG
jgi:hypothetical protein